MFPHDHKNIQGDETANPETKKLQNQLRMVIKNFKPTLKKEPADSDPKFY